MNLLILEVIQIYFKYLFFFFFLQEDFFSLSSPYEDYSSMSVT